MLDADALIFVIDSAEYLRNQPDTIDFVAGQTSAIRAAWQHLVDNYRDLNKDSRKLPVVLVFTKSDLFGVLDEVRDDDLDESVEQRITRLGFESIPQIHELDVQRLSKSEDETLDQFADLLTYLRNEVSRFRCIFVSSFGTVDGRRLGVEELLTSVLPRSWI